MNTLMNSHNGRAEEAATLADTMGRQKHGCSLAWRPSRSVSGNERDRERKRRDAEGKRARTDGAGENVGQRTCIICEKKRNSFTPTVFGAAGPVMTLGSIDNKIAGPMISERKGTTACRRRQSYARVH